MFEIIFINVNSLFLLLVTVFLFHLNLIFERNDSLAWDQNTTLSWIINVNIIIITYYY